MVIRPNRPRTPLSEKGDYDKLLKKSQKLQQKNDIFSHRKYLRYALIFGILGFGFSKLLTNLIFVKKSNKEEIIEYKVIEDSNKLKEYNWMNKLLKLKNEN